MNIKDIAWGIAVKRIVPPAAGGDPIVREIALKQYVDNLTADQDRIIADFNAVIDALKGFILVPKEPTAEMCNAISGTRVNPRLIYKAMIEALEVK